MTTRTDPQTNRQRKKRKNTTDTEKEEGTQ